MKLWDIAPIDRRQGTLDRGLAVWLSWNDSLRSRTLSSLLGTPLYLFDPGWTGIRRHLGGAIWTIRCLGKTRPKLVLLQNSFLLLVVCAAYKVTAAPSAKLVVDCHNKSLKRTLTGPMGSVFRWLKSWSFRQSTAVIVSNPNLVAHAEVLNPRILVLRDPLPRFNATDGCAESRDGPGPIVFVCSFDADEPSDLIVATAARAAEEVQLPVVITGDMPDVLREKHADSLSAIQAPGFLPRKAYIELIHRSSVMIVLTTEPDCLMCGATEALALGKPVVLSEHDLLKDYFGSFARYSRHEEDELLRAIKASLTVDCSAPARLRTRMKFDSDFNHEFGKLVTGMDVWYSEAIGNREGPEP